MRYSEILKKLRGTRSLVEKKTILAQADNETKRLFEYAYHPFKHYYMAKLPPYKKNKPQRQSWYNDYPFGLLDQLASRTISGDGAKVLIAELCECFSPEDTQILSQVLKKDLRCGVGIKTLNQVWPDFLPDYGVMKAYKWDDARFEPNMYMSLKIDGIRARFENGVFRTRKGHRLYGFGALTDLISPKWKLDGELIVPGEHFNTTSGLVRNHNPVPGAKFHIFDVPDLGLPFEERVAYMNDLVKDHPRLTVLKHVKARSLEHIKTTFDKALAAGYEGLVVKTGHHFYENKRSYDWLKLKNFKTTDVPCVGFYEGEGRLEGTLGGIIVERKNGVHVRVGSGFSDMDRDIIWADKEKYKDVVVEVKYHEETPAGSLRHPVFKKWRWDK